MRNKEEMIKYLREFFQTWTQIKYHSQERGWSVMWENGKVKLKSYHGDIITQFDVFPRPTPPRSSREMIINLINDWQFNTWDEVLDSKIVRRCGWFRLGTSLSHNTPAKPVFKKDVVLRND